MARRRQRRALMRSASAAFFLLLSTSVFAQQLSENITVNVVEVPVYVSRWGHSVTDLTKDDFILTVNGKPQTIEYFDRIVNETVTADAPAIAAAPIDLERRRLIVLLFDAGSMSLHSIRRAQKTADEYVQTAPRGDVFAVALLTRSGIEFAVPLMSDRVAVRRAIATLRTSRASDAFGIATLAAERGAVLSSAEAAGFSRFADEWSVPGLNSGAFFAGSRGAAIHQQAVEEMKDFEREIETNRRSAATGALTRLADRLAPLSGIKHVVLLGEGGEVLDVRFLAQADQTSELSLLMATRKLHEKYRRAGVVLDAVDVSQMTDNAADPHFSAFSLLHMLSLDTGGSVVRSMPQLREMQRVTYILGFNSRHAAKQNNVEVRLRNAPLFTEVRYRRTFSNSGDEDAPDDGLFLADVLLNDIPQRGMTLALDVDASQGGVVINATVPGKELLALGGEELQLDAFIYLFDESGQVAEWAFRRSKLDLVKARDVLDDESYTITSRVTLAPGRYVAKVLLRAGERDATAFARSEVTVN